MCLAEGCAAASWRAVAVGMLLAAVLGSVRLAQAKTTPGALSPVAFARGDSFTLIVSADFPYSPEGEGLIETESEYMTLPLRGIAYCMVARSGNVLLSTMAGQVYEVVSVNARHVTLHLVHDISSYATVHDLGALLSFDYDGQRWLFEFYRALVMKSGSELLKIPVDRIGNGSPSLLASDCIVHSTASPDFRSRLYPKLYHGKVICPALSGVYEINMDGTYARIDDYWENVRTSSGGEAFYQNYSVPSILSGDVLYVIGSPDWHSGRDTLLMLNLSTRSCKVLPLKIMNSAALFWSVRRDILSVWFIFFPAWRGRAVDFDLDSLSLRSCFPTRAIEPPHEIQKATVTYE